MPDNSQLLIISGLSGAGKSHVSSVLEDCGWFVIDNFLPELLFPIYELIRKSDGSLPKLAVVIDVRSGEFFDKLNTELKKLKSQEIEPKILFVEADDASLVKRFEKVRRPHPLQNNGTILDGIKRERDVLSVVRENCDYLIDTSGLSIHDTSRRVKNLLESTLNTNLKITVMSFGFKYGAPHDAEIMFDMRFLPNPFWVENLRDLSGLDQKVSDYIFDNQMSTDFFNSYVNVIKKTFDGFLYENKTYLTVAFGCTGGRHRSVAFAEKFAKVLTDDGYNAFVYHRDISKVSE